MHFSAEELRQFREVAESVKVACFKYEKPQKLIGFLWAFKSLFHLFVRARLKNHCNRRNWSILQQFWSPNTFYHLSPNARIQPFNTLQWVPFNHNVRHFKAVDKQCVCIHSVRSIARRSGKEKLGLSLCPLSRWLLLSLFDSLTH